MIIWFYIEYFISLDEFFLWRIWNNFYSKIAEPEQTLILAGSSNRSKNLINRYFLSCWWRDFTGTNLLIILQNSAKFQKNSAVSHSTDFSELFVIYHFLSLVKSIRKSICFGWRENIIYNNLAINIYFGLNKQNK